MTNKNEILERKDVPKEQQWDLESMFANIEEWQKSFDKAMEMAKEFSNYNGKVLSNSKTCNWKR